MTCAAMKPSATSAAIGVPRGRQMAKIIAALAKMQASPAQRTTSSDCPNTAIAAASTKNTSGGLLSKMPA